MTEIASLTALDAALAHAPEAELLARVVAGLAPGERVVAWTERLSRLPFWERRNLGAMGLVRDHALPAETAVRLAALWELAERWYPDEGPP